MGGGCVKKGTLHGLRQNLRGFCSSILVSVRLVFKKNPPSSKGKRAKSIIVRQASRPEVGEIEPKMETLHRSRVVREVESKRSQGVAGGKERDQPRTNCREERRSNRIGLATEEAPGWKQKKEPKKKRLRVKDSSVYEKKTYCKIGYHESNQIVKRPLLKGGGGDTKRGLQA